MAAPNFLTIHPEIRELIYTIHLTTPDPLGPPSTTRANRLPPRSWLHKPSWPSILDTDVNERATDASRFDFEYATCYPDPIVNPAKPASLSLLLCNRQINAEVSSVIIFLTTHTEKLRYETDCEIINEVELYPTWLHIPVRFKDVPIPCLHATFRVTGKLGNTVRSGWGHNAGPRTMVWSLLALLNRFLKIGPNFIAQRAETPAPAAANITGQRSSFGKAKIKALVHRIFKSEQGTSSRPSSIPKPALPQNQISSDTSNCVKVAPSSLTRHELDARGKNLLEMIDPMVVARLLKEQLDFLFSGSSYTIEYGGFIASRVGSVHLRSDGEVLAEWDLAGREVLHTD